MTRPTKDLRNFRICRICAELRHISCYHKDYKRLDNISVRCKICTKAYRQHIKEEKMRNYPLVALLATPEFDVSFN